MAITCVNRAVVNSLKQVLFGDREMRAVLFALHYFGLHVETEGDVLFSLSRQCKQTCLRR